MLAVARRPRDVGGDREPGHRDRPAEVDRDARQAHRRQGALQRPHEQSCRRTAVAGVGIPRPAGDVVGDEPLTAVRPVLDGEERLGHLAHATRR